MRRSANIASRAPSRADKNGGRKASEKTNNKYRIQRYSTHIECRRRIASEIFNIWMIGIFRRWPAVIEDIARQRVLKSRHFRGIKSDFQLLTG